MKEIPGRRITVKYPRISKKYELWEFGGGGGALPVKPPPPPFYMIA